MKPIILLLLLVCGTLSAQTFSIYQTDENYYLRTIETVDNGTSVKDTIVTTRLLGDTSTYENALRNLDATYTNEYVRLVARIQEINQSVRDRELTNAAEAAGVNLDSLNDAFFGRQLVVDTLRLVIFTDRLAAADLLEWTLDLNPPAKLILDAEAEFRPNGNIRLRTTLSGTNRMIMDGKKFFRMINFPGAESFYKESENENLSSWRTANEGLPTMRITSFKVARNRVSASALN